MIRRLISFVTVFTLIVTMAISSYGESNSQSNTGNLQFINMVRMGILENEPSDRMLLIKDVNTALFKTFSYKNSFFADSKSPLKKGELAYIMYCLFDLNKVLNKNYSVKNLQEISNIIDRLIDKENPLKNKSIESFVSIKEFYSFLGEIIGVSSVGHVSSINTPVILIHGRGDNSNACFGAETFTDNKNNVYGISSNSKLLYSSIGPQKILSYSSNSNGVENQIVNDLVERGYKINVDLFVFNYPNQDMVNVNADILKSYIDNLKKYKFSDNQKFNIISHSMGGLISRFYIENLYQSKNVDKLVTIDTPHYGSEMGFYSQNIVGGELLSGAKYSPCDLDLIINNKIFGGTNGLTNSLIPFIDKLTRKDKEYAVNNQTAKLNDSHLETEYYFIASYDAPDKISTWSSNKIYPVNININDSVSENMIFNTIKMNIKQGDNPFDASELKGLIDYGDDVVSLSSQMGYNKKYSNKSVADKITILYETYPSDSTISDQVHMKATKYRTTTSLIYNWFNNQQNSLRAYTVNLENKFVEDVYGNTLPAQELWIEHSDYSREKLFSSKYSSQPKENIIQFTKIGISPNENYIFFISENLVTDSAIFVINIKKRNYKFLSYGYDYTILNDNEVEVVYTSNSGGGRSDQYKILSY